MMALDSKVGEILNKQINKEFYSAYLYLTFADFFEDKGLKGFANWYVIQSQEEVAHARILRRYLLDNDWMPKMEAITKPDLTFTEIIEPLKAALEHEKYITASINECYAVAQSVNDYRTMKLTLPIRLRPLSFLVGTLKISLTWIVRMQPASIPLLRWQCSRFKSNVMHERELIWNFIHMNIWFIEQVRSIGLK